jgi:hypothetical protein
MQFQPGSDSCFQLYERTHYRKQEITKRKDEGNKTKKETKNDSKKDVKRRVKEIMKE